MTTATDIQGVKDTYTAWESAFYTGSFYHRQHHFARYCDRLQHLSCAAQASHYFNALTDLLSLLPTEPTLAEELLTLVNTSNVYSLHAEPRASDADRVNMARAFLVIAHTEQKDGFILKSTSYSEPGIVSSLGSFLGEQFPVPANTDWIQAIGSRLLGVHWPTIDVVYQVADLSTKDVAAMAIALPDHLFAGVYASSVVMTPSTQRDTVVIPDDLSL